MQTSTVHISGLRMQNASYPNIRITPIVDSVVVDMAQIASHVGLSDFFNALDYVFNLGIDLLLELTEERACIAALVVAQS